MKEQAIAARRDSLKNFEIKEAPDGTIRWDL
jgi:hypothetical protein